MMIIFLATFCVNHSKMISVISYY